MPFAPDVTDTQLSFVVAVQTQLEVVATATEPVPPAFVTLALVGAIVYAHGAGEGVGVGAGAGGGDAGGGSGAGGCGAGVGVGVGATGTAACEMVAIASPTRTVPVRAAPPLAATLTTMDPDFVPVGFGGSESHDESVVAVHEHPVSVSTAIVTAPPFAETVAFAGATLKRHGAGSWTIRICVLLTSTFARRWTGSPFAATV